MAGKAPAVAVFDSGKTNIKLYAIDEGGQVLQALSAPTPARPGPPYAHIDVEASWSWMTGALAGLGDRFAIQAIVPVGCGSTAALVDGEELVLPVMDYEAVPPPSIIESYAAQEPPFREVCSPTNPAGMTLARQLLWQQTAFPDAFARARHILFQPQYWAWRLSGVAAGEVTSLGAQTHLWNPARRGLSTLAHRQGWAPRLPPLRKAWERLGPIRAELAAATDLPRDTPVLCGIHDSSANYLRYRAAGLSDFTLMSTGTWLISFNAALPIAELPQGRDAVSNSDVESRPVACSRFMLGREHALLAGANGEKVRPALADIEAVIASGAQALPSFTDTGGPFPWTGGAGRIQGTAPTRPGERAALATLFGALMSSAAIEVIGSANDIVIDGPFAADPLFPSLMAALRPKQRIRLSSHPDGTALGAALLARWSPRAAPVPVALSDVEPLRVGGLEDYAAAWREAIPPAP
jgi:sugar (pentulose or hexulose) kinase